MKLLGFLLVAIFWPLISFASVIEVRTGEHDDFTRVVLSIPEGAEWRLGRRAQGYVLRLPDAERFELAGFFDLIPRARIAAVSQDVDNGELRVDVSCRCYAQAYLFRPDLLVLDVRDGLPNRISSFELSLDAPAASRAQAQGRPIVPPYQVPRRRLLPLIPSVAPAISEPGTPADDVVDQVAPAQAPVDREQAIDEQLTDLENAIVAGLGEALTGGLLEGGLQAPAGATSGDLGPLIASDSVFPGILARTSVDPNAVAALGAKDQTQTGQSCQPDSYFHVSSWRDERPFFEQLNEARRALVPEFERLDEEAVTNLARLYVSFGFGREALQTLEIDGAKSQERQYLRSMAMIVDGDQPEQDLYVGQVSCPSVVALWAVLATQETPFDAKVDTVAVLTAFRMLPENLKRGLSVPLSEKLLAIGDTDAALQLLGNPPEQGSIAAARVLADAALLDALGEEDQAIATVVDAAQTNVRNSPALMIRFFEDGIVSGRAFTNEDFLLADALWFEQSDAPLAQDMIGAQVRAYLSVGRFDDAYPLLAQVNSEARKTLLNAFYLAAANQMEPVPFLRLVLPKEDLEIDQATRVAIAQRLLEMGFPGQSQAFLANPVPDRELDDQLYLQARNSIALGQPEVAISLLADRVSEKARDIREEAIQARVTRAVLQQTMAEAEGVAVGPSEITNAPLDGFEDQARPIEIGPDMPLTSGRALLEGSAETRARLDELLQTFEAPDVQ